VNCSIHSRLKNLLAAVTVAMGMAVPAWADIVSNCFRVVNYSVCWHVECTLDGFTNALDMAIDDNANNGFRAGDHGSQPYAYFAAVESGETIDACTFIRMTGMVEFVDKSDFIVAFAIGCSELNKIDGNFGWVRVAYECGTIVLKGGALNTTRGSPLVACGFEQGNDPGGGNDEEDDLVFDWVVIDHGDYLEFGEQARPSGTSGKVTIPSEIGGKPVCSIGEAAFYCHDEIRHVVIPETVSNIGYKAFNCCTALERCNIPSGVTNIDEMAFSHTALREITLPDGVREIKNWAFSHCESLSNAVWGAGVTNIGEMAFCVTALSSVTIGAQVEYIDFGAFQGCNMKSVSIWPWTRLGVQPFDLSCEIGYTGTVTNFLDFARECGEDVTNLMVWAGRENFNGVTDFRVYDDYGPLYGYEYGTSKLLHHAGLAPGSPCQRDNVLEVKYTNPRIEIVSFDIASRKIRGKIVPQGGCRIAQMPEDAWIFGIWHYESLDSQGKRDWDATPDLTGYLDAGTLGEFTHTISEEDFAASRFFKLGLEN